MPIEWDQRKADLNYHKHRVSFEEAASALEDPFSKILPDPDHSDDEERFIAFRQVSARAAARDSAHISRRSDSPHQRPQGDAAGTKDL
jgi:uncharacterized protein